MRVAVIGAGLMGRMLAWRLAESGAKVSLLDAQARDYIGTGLVAAAMIAPNTEAVMAEPLVKEIGQRSLTLWPEYLNQLEQSTAQQVYFSDAGTLLLAHSQDQADWQHFMQHAQIKLPQAAFTQLDQAGLEKLEPELAQNFKQATHFSGEAVLDNQQLYTSLARYFDQQDIAWHENTPIEYISDDGKIDGFDTAFDYVFDCRGNGAMADTGSGNGCGNQVKLRAVRGEVLRVYAPEVKLAHAVRLIHPRYPIYIAPKADNHYVIGATQIESKHMTPVTVRSGLELLSALYSLHPGFAEAQIDALQVGCRPAYSDNLPKICKQNKRISVNGLFRHGYLFAPTLAEMALAILNAGELRFPEVYAEC